MSSVSGEIKCAFKAAVVALRTAFKWLVSSCPQVTG